MRWLLAWCLFFVACSSFHRSFHPLVGQGILPLSSENPYLGSNFFLAEEMQADPLLRRFVESRGSPVALELQERDDGDSFQLFYPTEQEVYRATRREAGDRWVVAGPFAISRYDYQFLRRLLGKNIPPAVFVLDGQRRQFAGARALREPVKVVAKVPTPAATLKPKKKPSAPSKHTAKAPEVAGHEPSHGPAITPSLTSVPQLPKTGPLSSDQQALQIARGFTERTPEGDILHSVKSEGESLKEIAGWYTKSEANTEAIATANQLTAEATLSPGTKIRIPALLVREMRAMPSRAKTEGSGH